MDSKISALNSATVLTDADVLPIVNGGETKKVTVELLKSQVTVPTQTSELTNNGADGVNPFITALDIPTTGQASTIVREVKNMTGATLTKGTVVYISGANGNKALVSKALATTDALSSRTFGLLQSNISNNGLGYCVIIGDLSGLDTSAFTEGAQLYLSGITAGTYTDTKILAPTHLVYVGKVTRSHPTQGQIEVGIQNGYELEEIHDVLLSSPTNNEVLVYEQATDLWKNKTIPTILGFNPIKTVVRDGNASTTITGNTSEQPIGIYLIPANTYTANDIMRIATLTFEKIGTVGNCFVRVKIGTSATGVGATTIASYTLGSTSIFANVIRSSMIIRGGNIRVVTPTTSLLTDVLGTTIAPTNVTFNPAVDNYISTTLQLGSASDSVFQSSFLVTN